MEYVKRIKKKAGGDLSDEMALGILKDEILEEVRAVAFGIKVSIYELVDMGREMDELEKKILAGIDEAKVPKKTKSSKKEVEVSAEEF